MDLFALAFILLLIATVSLAIMASIAGHVVRKYPDPRDPDRSAKRYTRPAAILLFVGIGTLFGAIVAAIVGIVT